MAVGIRLKFAGGTQENYEAAHGVMDIESNPPEGMIVHSAGPVDGGWGVIDFWESREAFDNFVSGRLMPNLQGLGDRGFRTHPTSRSSPYTISRSCSRGSQAAGCLAIGRTGATDHAAGSRSPT